MEINSCRFEEYTREHIGKIASKTLAIIPVGAIEQHGTHLPVGTDSMILEHFATQVAKRMQNKDIIVAPPVWYGSSHHHLMYPGVMSLRGETLLSVLCDLGDSLVKGGFKRIFFLISHGGNESIVRQAVLELTMRHDNIIVGASGYWDIAKETFERGLMDYGVSVRGHAGLSETSMILALRNHLVDRGALESYKEKDFAEHNTIRFSALRKQAYVRRSKYMGAQNGLSDSPVNASRELGEKLLEGAIDNLVDFFENLIKHP